MVSSALLPFTFHFYLSFIGYAGLQLIRFGSTILIWPIAAVQVMKMQFDDFPVFQDMVPRDILAGVYVGGIPGPRGLEFVGQFPMDQIGQIRHRRTPQESKRIFHIRFFPRFFGIDSHNVEHLEDPQQQGRQPLAGFG